MPSTPVRPKPNRIFIRSAAHLHAAKIMASPDRSLAPLSQQQHDIEATPTRTTPTSLPREDASSHRLQHKRRTVASAERCKDQNHHDGLRPHQGTATSMELTRASSHTPAPTPPGHHRALLTRRLAGHLLPTKLPSWQGLLGAATSMAERSRRRLPPAPARRLPPPPLCSLLT